MAAIKTKSYTLKQRLVTKFSAAESSKTSDINGSVYHANKTHILVKRKFTNGLSTLFSHDQPELKRQFMSGGFYSCYCFHFWCSLINLSLVFSCYHSGFHLVST